mmetsp:Transcript_121512/g.349227  ORF Transcript_121512/g.349227 Transcript_121512/m.349227 type:complete len:321 (+) Transcript_121512:342-1304(+)
MTKTATRWLLHLRRPRPRSSPKTRGQHRNARRPSSSMRPQRRRRPRTRRQRPSTRRSWRRARPRANGPRPKARRARPGTRRVGGRGKRWQGRRRSSTTAARPRAPAASSPSAARPLATSASPRTHGGASAWSPARPAPTCSTSPRRAPGSARRSDRGRRASRPRAPRTVRTAARPSAASRPERSVSERMPSGRHVAPSAPPARTSSTRARASPGPAKSWASARRERRPAPVTPRTAWTPNVAQGSACSATRRTRPSPYARRVARSASTWATPTMRSRGVASSWDPGRRCRRHGSRTSARMAPTTARSHSVAPSKGSSASL